MTIRFWPAVDPEGVKLECRATCRQARDFAVAGRPDPDGRGFGQGGGGASWRARLGVWGRRRGAVARGPPGRARPDARLCSGVGEVAGHVREKRTDSPSDWPDGEVVPKV